MLLDEYTELIAIKSEKEKAFCCGGSLANIKIGMNARNQIRDNALDSYNGYHPDALVTPCPLCKKTFTKSNKLPIFDISEIVYMAITQKVEITEPVSPLKEECLINVDSFGRKIY